MGRGGGPLASGSSQIRRNAGDAGGDGESNVCGGPLTVCVAAPSGLWTRPSWCEGDLVYRGGRREAPVPLKLDSGNKVLFGATPMDSF